MTHPIGSQSSITRRDLLRRSGLFAGAFALGPALLAACGGNGDDSAGPGGSTSGTINFFGWQGYDLVDVAPMKSWLKQSGIEVKSTYISNHDEITAKFSSGGGKGLYNLSTYFAGYGPLYRDLGLLTPIDIARVPNFADAFAVFREGDVAEQWWNVDGTQWGIPFTWGILGINYDSAEMDEPTSYSDLLAPELKGRIGITDDFIGIIVIGALSLGIFKPDSLYTPSELAQILDFWVPFKDQARSIVASYGDVADQMVAGEIVAAVPGWAAVNSFAAQKGLESVSHTVPTEGAPAFVDAFFIPAESDDIDSVYAFINQALSPEVQAATADFLVQGIANEQALSLMSAETRALYPYDNVDEVFTSLAPLEAIPIEVPDGYANFDDWISAWEEFKAQ